MTTFDPTAMNQRRWQRKQSAQAADAEINMLWQICQQPHYQSQVLAQIRDLIASGRASDPKPT